MARRFLRIPLVAIPQSFNITLGGRGLTLVCRWNGHMPAWVLDLYDAETDAALLLSLPIVTGADLLSQFRHIFPTGSLVAWTNGDIEAPPTETSLGVNSNLFYVVTT